MKTERSQQSEREPVTFTFTRRTGLPKNAGLCPLARELTYNGQVQELVDVKDIPEGTLCYSLDGEAFGLEIPTGTDAGDYIVYYRAAGEEAAQVSSLTVTISKADVIFTAPSAVE